MEIQISKKTIKIVGLVAIGLFAIFVLQLLLTSGRNDTGTNENSSTVTQQSGNLDKIQVVHFHATQQCWSCTTVGKYAKDTIIQKFPDEYKNSMHPKFANPLFLYILFPFHVLYIILIKVKI